MAIGVTYNHAGAIIDIQTGSFSLSGAVLTLDASSVLSGSGTFIGDVINTAGTVSPGGAGATGILTINGVYTQGANGALLIELQGTAVGTGYDQLSVSGNANLDGSLTISEINGFNAVALDSFTYLTTAGIINGDFGGKRIFPVGFALPQTTLTQQSIGFGDGVTVYFDNFIGNADWNDANNWSSGFVPTAGLDVNTLALAPGLPVIVISGGTHVINNLITGSNINNTGGSLTVSGNLTVPANFVYTQNGANAFTQFDGTFNDAVASGVLIDNISGSMNLNGTVNADVMNNGNMTNTGVINGLTVTNNANGLLVLGGTTVADITNTGNMVVDGNVNGNVINDGSLSGSGTVTGNVTNGGSFSPGNSPRVFTIIGDLNLLDTSILNIEIAGLVQGVEYDELIVTGNIFFNGQLNIIVDTTAYVGNLQDSFDPITFGSGSGDIVLTASKGFGYDLTVDVDRLNLLTILVPGLFIPDTQNEVVTLTNTAKNTTNAETIDDLEEELVSSDEEGDEEKGSALVCT